MINRPLFVTILLIFVFGTQAQLTQKPIGTQPYQPNYPKRVAATSHSTLLPFWDDFSQSGITPDSIQVWEKDTFALWDLSLGKGTSITPSLSIRPPTYQAVTFDGLDSNGQFYNASGYGLTDELISHPLDLSGLNTDETYISFFWQAGGNMEAPDSRDSIVLKLTGDITRTLWQQAGSDTLETDSFYFQLVKIPASLLLDSIRLHFASYGDQNGPFDTWHIDWIYLNENDPDQQNGSFEDVAFTGEVLSPLQPFQSVPYSVFKEDPNSSLFDLTYTLRYLGKKSTDRSVSQTYTVTDLINNEILTSKDEPNIGLNVNNPSRTIASAFPDINAGNLPDDDTLYTQIKLWHQPGNNSDPGDGLLADSPINLKVNDTVKVNHLLANFYAFDDGSAEYAAGTNVNFGQVAVQYWVPEPDTLTDIDILFPNINPLSDGQALNLRIFSHLDDEETGLLREQPVTIPAARTDFAFTRFTLNAPIVVKDTFFVGYQQSINQYIGVGLDRSNPTAAEYIFENFENQWVGNKTIEGALMIRPVFRTIPDSVVLGNIAPEKELIIYPNPSFGRFQVEGEYDRVELLNLSGHVLLSEKRKSIHQINQFAPGIYLLRITSNHIIQTKKLILK